MHRAIRAAPAPPLREYSTGPSLCRMMTNDAESPAMRQRSYASSGETRGFVIGPDPGAGSGSG